MLLELSWTDAAVRLALAIVAGVVIGFNREERSQSVRRRPARAPAVDNDFFIGGQRGQLIEDLLESMVVQ